ncbi:MAG: hypothetical protein ACE5H7_17825 [Acidiferrobacterales bacterium]
MATHAIFAEKGRGPVDACKAKRTGCLSVKEIPRLTTDKTTGYSPATRAAQHTQKLTARAGAWVPPGMAYGALDDQVSLGDAHQVDEPDRIDTEPASDTEAEPVPGFLTADSPPVDAEASQA